MGEMDWTNESFRTGMVGQAQEQQHTCCMIPVKLDTDTKAVENTSGLRIAQKVIKLVSTTSTYFRYTGTPSGTFLEN